MDWMVDIEPEQPDGRFELVGERDCIRGGTRYCPLQLVRAFEENVDIPLDARHVHTTCNAQGRVHINPSTPHPVRSGSLRDSIQSIIDGSRMCRREALHHNDGRDMVPVEHRVDER